MLGQVKLARHEGIYDLIIAEMDSLLTTAEMEYNGLFINQGVMSKNKKILEGELVSIYDELEVLSQGYEMINFNSPQQVSCLFFGGLMTEECQVPILNELGIHQQYKTKDRRGEYKYKKGTRDITIKGFGLIPDPKWQTKKVGIYQTNEKILQTIADGPDIDASKVARLMLEYKAKKKLLGTYYTGWQKLIHTDGCVHGSINHVKTNTGRTSSTNPNLQNIPRG